MHYLLKESLSHKQWRAFLKKERRKRKRKELAFIKTKEEEQKLCILTADPAYQLHIEEQEFLEEEAARMEEIAAARRREEFLARDLELHSLWLENKRKERKIIEDKRRREEQLKKEWEESVQKEQNEKRKKQEQQEALLQEATSNLGMEATRNPDPPSGYSRNFTEQKIEPCPFFLKTGACRFGPQCSREHRYPPSGRTVLLQNMYSHFGLDGELTDDYDMDLSLEFTESDRNNHFRDFYLDVLPEFEKCGRVTQFKACCNKSAHLRGNVYVQYESADDAQRAVKTFNGRWYGGKQISCIFIPVERWKTAICGLYWSHKCPKGDRCNFLHVFRNPGNAFYKADKDIDVMGESPRNRDQGFESRRQGSRTRSSSKHSRSSSSRSSRKSSHRSSRSSRSDSRDRNSRKRNRSREKNREKSSRNTSEGNSSRKNKTKSRNRS